MYAAGWLREQVPVAEPGHGALQGDAVVVQGKGPGLVAFHGLNDRAAQLNRC
jgi:hypothetical protein